MWSTAGKSLVYQLPVLLLEHSITVVVSPVCRELKSDRVCNNSFLLAFWDVVKSERFLFA